GRGGARKECVSAVRPRARWASGRTTSTCSLVPRLRLGLRHVRGDQPGSSASQGPAKSVPQEDRYEQDGEERQRWLRSERLPTVEAESNTDDACDPDDQHHRNEIAIGTCAGALPDEIVRALRRDAVR